LHAQGPRNAVASLKRTNEILAEMRVVSGKLRREVEKQGHRVDGTVEMAHAAMKRSIQSLEMKFSRYWKETDVHIKASVIDEIYKTSLIEFDRLKRNYPSAFDVTPGPNRSKRSVTENDEETGSSSSPKTTRYTEEPIPNFEEMTL
jgi:hypothetical protein